MKTLLLSFLFISFNYFCFAGTFYVQNPLQGGRQIANIDSAKITVTPYIYYAQVDLELVVSADGTSLVNNPNADLEIVAGFDIDEDVIIVDSWLWMEDYIAEAYLIDVFSATNIYESYVTRQQDPSLLKYHAYQDNKLTFNIYPMVADSTRKVLLTFLVPIENLSTTFSINPIVDLLINENISAHSYLEIELHNSLHYNNGGLATSPLNYTNITNTTSSINTSHFEMDFNKLDENFRISYSAASPVHSFGYSITPEGQYYHVEKFISVNTAECTFGTLDKVMDNSSLIFNEQLETTISANGLIVKESGSYFNNPPESIILEYICDSVVHKDTIANQAELTPIAEKKWAKDRIDDFSLAFDPNNYYYGNYFDASDVIALSMEHRVLSKFTAFLALPIEDSALASVEGANQPQFSVGLSQEEHNNSISAFPNPMFENLTIMLNFESLTQNEEVTIRIMDVTGRVIKTFESFELQSNSKEVYWNGETENGESASAGVYFAVVRYGNYSKTVELIKR